MTYERSQYVQDIMDDLKRQSGLKGIVSPAEVYRLCQHIRELLSDRANVVFEKDWIALEDYTLLCRPFTTAEANRIHMLYGQYKYPRIIEDRKKQGRKRHRQLYFGSKT
jgi:hypothetical protein